MPVLLPSPPVVCYSVVHQELAHATSILDTLTVTVLQFFWGGRSARACTFPNIFSLQLPPNHNVLLQIIMFFFFFPVLNENG